MSSKKFSELQFLETNM